MHFIVEPASFYLDGCPLLTNYFYFYYYWTTMK
jgi:hypothetical protein